MDTLFVYVCVGCGVYQNCLSPFFQNKSKFFPLRVDTFQNRLDVQVTKQEITKVASLLK